MFSNQTCQKHFRYIAKILLKIDIQKYKNIHYFVIFINNTIRNRNNEQCDVIKNYYYTNFSIYLSFMIYIYTNLKLCTHPKHRRNHPHQRVNNFPDETFPPIQPVNPSPKLYSHSFSKHSVRNEFPSFLRRFDASPPYVAVYTRYTNLRVHVCRGWGVYRQEWRHQ